MFFLYILKKNDLNSHLAIFRSKAITKYVLIINICLYSLTVPTQKMPRLLSTSAGACRQLMLKADLMGIDTAALEFQEAQMAALADVRKKWHIPPAFSVEFIGYYLDRIARLKDMKAGLGHQMQLNRKLVDDQLALRTAYDDQMREQQRHAEANVALRTQIGRLHAAIAALVPHKQLPSVDVIGRRPEALVAPVPSPVANARPTRASPQRSEATTTDDGPSTGGQRPAVPNVNVMSATAVALAPPPARPMSVPTAAALKMGVGFPLVNLSGTPDDPNRILSTQCQIRTGSGASSATAAAGTATKLMHECGICAKRTDQHLLAKCDTCQLHYHLGCLHPPLQRHPKKSKLYGWQCSECVKSDDSDAPASLPVGPRKSRTKYAKDGTIVPVDGPPAPMASTAAVVGSDSIGTSETGTPEEPRKKGPGRPRNADKRPAAAAAVQASVATGSDGGSPVKPKKFRKSAVTVADVVVPPVDCTGGPMNPLNQSNATDTSEDQPTAPAKPKSARKLKKAKFLADAAATAAAAAAAQKSSHYIDQNGVLTGIDAPPADGAQPSAAIHNSVAMTDEELLLLHKQNRKRRKELKHQRQRLTGADAAVDGLGASADALLAVDGGKEHKKKRSKRSKHDLENPSVCANDGIPRIKIKVSGGYDDDDDEDDNGKQVAGEAVLDLAVGVGPVAALQTIDLNVS